MKPCILSLILALGCSSSREVEVADTSALDAADDARDAPDSCDTHGWCCCSGEHAQTVECRDDVPACAVGSIRAGTHCAELCRSLVSADGGAIDADAHDSAACGSACCCQGDVLDEVVCTSAGPTCKPSYNVYYGDDCRCLPDRDTPCCLPHVVDGGS